jgi:hypothetical protein
METAGNILSALFDEGFVKKAQGYSKFFDSWTDITAKNGIAAAADHSRIKDLDRGIVLIETDHPGWKQILQTKQTKLLNDFRYRFPSLDICGISLILGKNEPQDVIQTENEAEMPYESSSPYTESEPMPAGLDAIKDEVFREKLIKLGKTISDSEKRKKTS